MPLANIPIQVIAIAVIVLAVVVVLVVFIARQSSPSRREVLAEALQQMGMQDLPDPKTADHLSWVNEIKKLNGGAKNLQQAWVGEREGRALEFLQHRYVVSTGQTTAIIIHRVLATPVPEHWPIVQLTEENLFTKIGSALGLQDIKVEGEQFNNRWRIKGDDETFTLLALGPEVQAELRDARKGQIWIIVSGRLVLMERGKTAADHLDRMIGTLLRVANAIPPELDAWQPDDSFASEETESPRGRYDS